ncbi:hypothetical protein GCM10009765_16740 [Fodinicola feengrottensis]|uniref:Peptidase M10 metallopeptidase domain-containing protein n=1 Tax=Fodinicola feengrottensis TaxID=435914 RepID=A0ABN2GBH3_9ACTN
MKDRLSTPADSRDRAAPARSRAGTATQELLRLQQSAGNRAVTGAVTADRAAVQRVPVTLGTRQETLFNQAGPGATAAPAVYGGNTGARADISRGGTPEVATVTVRIRFFDQARTPTGGNTGPRTALAPNDPRIAWATKVCTDAPGTWNNRGKLVSVRKPKTGVGSWFSPDPGGPVQLPLVFRAVPVWDLASPADVEIAVFGQATTAGGPQHPIDAGHYYMTKGANYPFPETAIYAHEYGHLIGLPDEYSQSNPQMHALLHDMDPGTAAVRQAAMDNQAVRRMVLAALARPLYDQLARATGNIAAALKRGSVPMVTALGGQLRAAISDPAVRALFESAVPPTSARLAPRVAAAVRGVTGSARGAAAMAGKVVKAEMAPAAVNALVTSQYWNALMAVHNTAANVGGIGININIQGSGITPSGLWAAAMSGPSAADAQAVTNQSVGALQTGRVPPGTTVQLDPAPTGVPAGRLGGILRGRPGCPEHRDSQDRPDQRVVGRRRFPCPRCHPNAGHPDQRPGAGPRDQRFHPRRRHAGGAERRTSLPQRGDHAGPADQCHRAHHRGRPGGGHRDGHSGWLRRDHRPEGSGDRRAGHLNAHPADHPGRRRDRRSGCRRRLHRGQSGDHRAAAGGHVRYGQHDERQQPDFPRGPVQ